jgi:hypothetical protein
VVADGTEEPWLVPRLRHLVAQVTEETWLVPRLRHLVADPTEEGRLVPRLRHLVAEATEETWLVPRLRHVVAVVTEKHARPLPRARRASRGCTTASPFVRADEHAPVPVTHDRLTIAGRSPA